jgi:hypothetical protein
MKKVIPRLLHRRCSSIFKWVEELHDAPVPAEAREALASLASKLESEGNKEKFAALTDTLASLYTQSRKI